MKKFIRFLLLIVLVSTAGRIEAQAFSLTPSGLRDIADTTKTYLVVSTEGIDAKLLYANSLKYIAKTYKNPNQVIKAQIDGEYVKFESYVHKISVLSVGPYNWDVSCMYTTEISFKDGKIKYEIINMNLKYYNRQGDTQELYIVGSGMTSWPIYNKNLKLKQPEVKKDIEDYFNSEVLNIRKALIEGNKAGDW